MLADSSAKDKCVDAACFGGEAADGGAHLMAKVIHGETRRCAGAGKEVGHFAALTIGQGENVWQEIGKGDLVALSIVAPN